MYKNIIKPSLDFLTALIVLPFWVLLFFFISPIIFLEDKGSIFYNAPRLGKNGKIFKMYKFRTMKMNAEDLRNDDGSTYNSENDPRLTKIGKFLRKTSIDETPQIVNVLIGNMSLIGPRPDLPEHKKLYKNDQIRKLDVKPGITGYNQAYYRNTVSWADRIKNDIYYLDHISLFLDIKIFFKTVFSVIFRKSIYIDSE